MSALDEMVQASFDGIAFPVKSVQVRGGLRDHVHEYPKSPGGAPEKLGRKLYTITMEGPFMNTFPLYGADLYPGNLADLFDRFENQLTSALVIPNIGTIQAYCLNWNRHLEAKIRSGEMANFEFREDQSSAFLIESLINIQARDLSTVASVLSTEADDADVGDDFDSLMNSIGQITAIVDQVELYGALAQAKISGIVGTFSELDKTVSALNDPTNYSLLEAFLDAWQAANDLNDNIIQQRATIVSYTVPKLMAVSDISRAIYGNNTHAIDILSLNPIEDAFSVAAGTLLKVFAPDSVKQAA